MECGHCPEKEITVTRRYCHSQLPMLKAGCFQRHSQLHPDTPVEDNHLFSMLHLTTYTMTGGKKQSKRRTLLDWSGTGDIRYKIESIIS